MMEDKKLTVTLDIVLRYIRAPSIIDYISLDVRQPVSIPMRPLDLNALIQAYHSNTSMPTPSSPSLHHAVTLVRRSRVLKILCCCGFLSTIGAFVC